MGHCKYYRCSNKGEIKCCGAPSCTVLSMAHENMFTVCARHVLIKPYSCPVINIAILRSSMKRHGYASLPRRISRQALAWRWHQNNEFDIKSVIDIVCARLGEILAELRCLLFNGNTGRFSRVCRLCIQRRKTSVMLYRNFFCSTALGMPRGVNNQSITSFGIAQLS